MCIIRQNSFLIFMNFFKNYFIFALTNYKTLYSKKESEIRNVTRAKITKSQMFEIPSQMLSRRIAPRNFFLPILMIQNKFTQQEETSDIVFFFFPLKRPKISICPFGISSSQATFCTIEYRPKISNGPKPR